MKADWIQIPKIFLDRKPRVDHPILFSLVIPTYNERNNLKEILDRITKILDQSLPNHYELIIVDDNSPDQTWDLANDLKHQYPCLQAFKRTSGRGLSTAVIFGWQKAQGEILGVMDADLQHPPEALVEMLDAIKRNDVDLVVGSRRAEGGSIQNWSWMRRFLSGGAKMIALTLLGDVAGRVSDPMSGFFLVKRRAIEQIPLNPTGYKIILEVLGRGEIKKITEVGYEFQDRAAGSSKVTPRIYLQYLWHLLRLRFSRGAQQRKIS